MLVPVEIHCAELTLSKYMPVDYVEIAGLQLQCPKRLKIDIGEILSTILFVECAVTITACEIFCFYRQIPDPEYPCQPPMVLFKQFLANQDESISEEEAVKRYNQYKLEFKKTQLNDFFLAHKDEEWLVKSYWASHSLPFVLNLY